MVIQLKRGYTIVVEREINLKADDIVYLGNYSKSFYQATPIVSVWGLSPTIRENHRQVVAICAK